VTHVVVSTNRTRTQKVRQAAKYPRTKIVNQQWLMDSMSRWRRVDESPYLIEIHREEKSPTDEDSGLQTPLSSDEASAGADTDEDEDDNRSMQNQEGLVPDEEATSPIDGLKQFDWDSAEQELAEFMASGDDDDGTGDSDTESIASRASENSQSSNFSIRTRDHKRKTDDSDEETDGESHIAKKKRLALARSTGLKTVKTPSSVQSESNLPTPDVTGGEDAEADDADQAATGEADDDLELEAEMMAEFEKADWDQSENGDGASDVGDSEAA